MYCVVVVLCTVNLCLDWQGIIKCTSNSPLFIVLVMKEKVGRGGLKERWGLISCSKKGRGGRGGVLNTRFTAQYYLEKSHISPPLRLTECIKLLLY